MAKKKKRSKISSGSSKKSPKKKQQQQQQQQDVKKKEEEEKKKEIIQEEQVATMEVVDEDEEDVVEEMQLDDLSDEEDTNADEDKTKKEADNVIAKDNDSKMDTEEEEEEEESKPTTTKKNTSFLDCFYNLSSDISPTERSLAARTLLQHIYAASPTTFPLKDASYSFKRLINGLCSGRAGARQGYASALATFLRIGCSFLVEEDGDGETKKRRSAMECIMDDMTSSSSKPEEEQQQQNVFEFVRLELLKHTSPSSSSSTTTSTEIKTFSTLDKTKSAKKRDATGGSVSSSVERDYAFGRLFGISSIVRSNTLLLRDDEDVPFSVIKGYAQDLIDLYHYKNWMREPASHGLLELISSFASASSASSPSSTKIMKDLISQVIVPQLLLISKEGEENKKDNRGELLKSFNAEQIAIAIQVQTLLSSSSSSADVDVKDKLPYPLDRPILCIEHIPYITPALKSTSNVVHPRSHLVWNCIWSFLTVEKEEGTKKKDEKKNKKKKHIIRVLRTKNPPMGNELPSDTLSYLFRHVVIKSMLGIGVSKEENATTATHEVKALALTIVQTLLGASNNYKIDVPSKMMEEDILQSSVVSKLFLDTICASGGGGGGGAKRKKKRENVQHTLKPLALHVLESIVESCHHYDDDGDGDNKQTDEDSDDNDDDEAVQKRLSIAKAVLSAEPRFDVRTKTSTVAELLSIRSNQDETEDEEKLDKIKKKRKQLMDGCLSYLETQILKCNGISSHQALGYLDFMVNNVAKKRLADADDNFVVDRIIAFLMVGAYFDCTGLKDSSGEDKKSKKKKKKYSKKDDNKKAAEKETMEILLAGRRVQDFFEKHGTTGEERSAIVPHSIRVLMSSRFMSLLSDRLSAMKGGAGQATTGKAQLALHILSDITKAWNALEKSGAVSFSTNASANEGHEEKYSDDDNEYTVEQSRKRVEEIQSIAIELAGSSEDESDKKDDNRFQAKLRCATGCASLLSALSLQLLSCGKKNQSDETSEDSNDDEDEDDIKEEIHEAISDLVDITMDLLRIVDEGPSEVAPKNKDKDDSDEEEEEENKPLVTLADLCVTSLSGSLASYKLTREMVKVAWAGGLAVASSVAPAFSDKKDDDDVGHLVDKDVMEVLLHSVCDEKSMEEEEDKEAEGENMNESDDEDMDGEGDDDNVFSTANATGLGLDDSMDEEEREADNNIESDGKDDTEKNNEDESDEELDPERLQNLLLEDSDADLSEGEDGQLEHHAGADKALAQLIKMKQEARKAGQNEREKVELSNRLRCLVLLEILFSSSNSLKGALVPTDVMLMSLLPLLRSRRVLEKAVISPPDEKKNPTVLNEKKALIEHLTSLIKNKICKTRISAVDSTEGHAIVCLVTKDVFCEARRSLSAAHCQCCSASLILTLKALPSPEDMVKIGQIYQDAVQEWSTRQTTRLNACLFDDLITKLPSVGKALLASPISTAAKESPKTYLKSESFRLMSTIFSNVAESHPEYSLFSEALKSSIPDAVIAIECALRSGDLLKAKRARDVLKAGEHVISFVNSQNLSDTSLRKTLESLLEQYNALSKSSPSPGIKQICAKLAEDVTSALEKKQVDEKMENSASKISAPKSSKKKKKSKKK